MTRMEMIEHMLISTPNDPFLHYAKGLELVNHNEEAAIESFRTVIEKFPDYLATYYQLAVLLVNRGMVEESIKVIETGMALAQKQGEMKTKQELFSLLDED